VQATYRGSDGAAVDRSEVRPEFDPTLASAPVTLPADVSWHGALALDGTGEYAFRVPPGFELRIDDEGIPDAVGPGARLRLVRGNHAVRLSGTITPSTQARLEWRPPGGLQWQPVPAEVLFQPPPGGLGLYLTLAAGLEPGGQPRDEDVDPIVAHYYHVSPFARLHVDPPVWSAQWVGQLDAPETGTYGFFLDHSQGAAVWIDDRQVVGNLNGLPDTRTTTLELASGRHALRVRYEKTVDGSPWLNLYWTPPGLPPSVVPGSALFGPPPVVLGPAQ
jgi:hypothetical protein